MDIQIKAAKYLVKGWYHLSLEFQVRSFDATSHLNLSWSLGKDKCFLKGAGFRTSIKLTINNSKKEI